MEQQQESKKAKKVEQDGQQSPSKSNSFSSDPAHFARRIDPNKHALSKPSCVGEFSLDITHRQQLGRSRVRYFDERVLRATGRKLCGASLAENFDTFVPKVVDAEALGIEQLLQWIMTMSTPNSSLRKTVHECDFVLWRGTLTRLSASPYDVGPFNVGVKVACTKHKGVYFVNELETEAKKLAESKRSDYELQIGYGGFKFEQLVTVDDVTSVREENGGAAGDVGTSTPVDQNNEFVGIFKATLNSSVLNTASAVAAAACGGNLSAATAPAASSPPAAPLRLFYGAEIDCISPGYGEFMEVKTQYKAIGHGKAFMHKALKWWIQSYLIGIKQLIVGIHENLILKRVELFPVDSLPKLAASLCTNASSGGCWSGAVCMEFLFQLLHNVRQQLDSLPEGAILLAERLPNGREFKFTAIAPEDASGQAEHCVLNEAFKNYSWR